MNILNINDDIIRIGYDILKNTNSKDLEHVSELILIYIPHLYDNKYHKYFYKEIIEQILSNHFHLYNSKYKFKLTDKSIDYIYNRLEELKLKPQQEQRSESWYAKRYNSIGASEVASIFNKSPFCTLKKYTEKKSLKPTVNTGLTFNKFCHHGVKYEPIVQQLYCIRENVGITEFGSIDHEKYSFISASPDGITTEGTMLEIKCPYSREIIGIPPIYYWYQMQQQLDVCMLNKCDFIECKITEYDNLNDFKNDNYNNDYTKNQFGLEKSCIIEYTNQKNELDYIYPDKLLTNIKDILEFHKNTKKQIDESEDKNFIKIIFWKVDVYSKFSIYRNKHWWTDNIKIVTNFWEGILGNRMNPEYSAMIQNKKPIKKKKKDEIYAFLSDSDTEL